MHLGPARYLALCFGLSLALPCLAAAPAPSRILVFSKTAAFRHDSIPIAVAAVQDLSAVGGFNAVASEDASQFTDENLAQFACVVFCLTTGDVLNTEQQGAFERYIRNGGGFVGVHSASDTEYGWEWYGRLVGAYFSSHSSVQSAAVILNDPLHPSTAGLPRRWVRTDEWYSFQSNPRGQAHVLATLDEKTFSPSESMGWDHPAAWCQEFEGGRAWYTGGGHTAESYSDPDFRRHLLGGILWATGAALGDAGATVDARFRKVVLVSAPRDPMQLAVAPDGRVFYIQRGGAFLIWKPEADAPILAAQLPIDGGREDGLLGLALDPGFAQNHWVYLFYSPLGPEPVQRVSRFQLNGDQLDFASEKILLTIPVQRETCCHSGGALSFGPAGELFIGTGDNTNPFESSSSSPIDERPNRSSWDAQKSSSNANDLRGKILRIKPQPDGTYSIPAGNLFPPGTPETRPEIYTMGNRNPFRFSIDAETGWLYWGEVGPDAYEDDPVRGPRGYDEVNQARSAGNYGWPYFVADNKAYRDYDFATQISGSWFDPAAPINDSPNNTGPVDLPPARPAWIWYPYANSREFPEMNGGAGRTAMAGPVYHYDATAAPNNRRLPAYYDKTLFLYEWSRSLLRELKFDDEGNILKISPFLPSFRFIRPIDMTIGPDGAIYLIEWGTGFYGANSDAQIVRLDYVGGPHLSELIVQSTAGLEYPFSADASATLDPTAGTISLPLPQKTRFFRFASPAPVRIRGVRIDGGFLILTYEEALGIR